MANGIVYGNNCSQRVPGPRKGWRIQAISATTRYVVLVGRWAVKIPKLSNWRMFLYGLQGNMQERAWSGHDDRLCPVVFSLPGGWLSIMLRAEPLPDATWAAWDARAMTDFIRREGGTELPVEYKRSSLGLLGGNIVAVDYAS